MSEIVKPVRMQIGAEGPFKARSRRINGLSAIKVDCGTNWQNPYCRKDQGKTDLNLRMALFEDLLASGEWHMTRTGDERQLRGVNLACRCPLHEPCCADILLRRANTHGSGA